LVLDAQTPSLKRLFRLKNLALMIAPNRVRAILNWRIGGAAPELKRVMTQEPTSNMLINFVDGAIELNGLDIGRAHVDTHDSKFVRYAKVRGRKLWEWKSLARLRGEIAVLGAAKSTIAISQVEAGFFRVLFGDRPVHLIPSYVAPRVPSETLDGVKTTDLLFVGSNNSYNRDGLKKFIRSNDTLLRARTLAVAGSVCSDNELKVLAAAYPNIRLLGWVDDLADLYRTAALVIAPVDGTGLNIKVLEALEHGKPVLASDHARHALPPGHDDCVFAIEVGTIDDFLEDPGRLGMAEKAAFEFARGPQMRGDIASLTRSLESAERST
jgi:glycosyltransferase involved in cell wall biosynthesis